MPDIVTKDDIKRLEGSISELKKQVDGMTSSILATIRKEMPEDPKSKVDAALAALEESGRKMDMHLLEMETRMEQMNTDLTIEVDDFLPAGGQ